MLSPSLLNPFHTAWHVQTEVSPHPHEEPLGHFNTRSQFTLLSHFADVPDYAAAAAASREYVKSLTPCKSHSMGKKTCTICVLTSPPGNSTGFE